VVPLIPVNPDSPQRHGISLREVGNDKCEVSGKADHRVGLVGVALIGPGARMRMYVGYDPLLLLQAPIPQRHVPAAAKDNDPAIEAMRIEVVVASIGSDPSTIGLCEEKGAAFSAALAPAAEVQDQLSPEPAGNRQAARGHIRQGLSSDE